MLQFLGLERVNLFHAKILQFFWLERVNPFHPKNATIFLALKGLTLSSPKKL
jgi:hypothetical protein